MKPPYALLSDIHVHSWSAFSTVNEDGVNSRLRIILDEVLRAARMLKDKGGNVMVIAGDLFHVRGSVKPSVMNPTFETFQQVCAMGIEVYAIAGNHDLEGSDADSLGNAMQTLGSIKGFHPIVETEILYEPHPMILFPWYSKLDTLRDKMIRNAKSLERSRFDCIIHAPVNGVVRGIPDIGLTPEELAAPGYHRVFAGHFHNYVKFLGGKVYSVGATSHQTWNDPGSLAGFLFVYEDHVDHIPTEAPLFVDLTKPEHISPAVVKGNYVRLKLTDVTEAEIKGFRDELESMGAKAVSIIATKKTEATREAKIRSGASLEESVATYIDKDTDFSDKAALQKEAADILMEVRSK